MRYEIVDEALLPMPTLPRGTPWRLAVRLESAKEADQIEGLIGAVIDWFRDHAGFEALMPLFAALANRVIAMAEGAPPSVLVAENLQEVRTMLANRPAEWRERWQQEGLAKGRQEGRQEGRRESQVSTLTRLLERRFGALPVAAIGRIAAADSATLDEWTIRVLDAGSIDDVLGSRAAMGSGAAQGMTVPRCHWAMIDDPVMQAYHDTEWGVPLRGDRALFELLSLEGAQAGLSWRTVLARREAYRAAYHGFDIGRVARMADADLDALLADSGLIRNRLKVFSVRENARAALAVPGGLDRFVWSFAGDGPVRNGWTDRSQVPVVSPASDAMSKALRKAGFRFVGSTICYAFMQASGMVDDHLTTCFRRL